MKKDEQHANLVGTVIRLFTNVQPKEDIYISPEAHEIWPAVPALRLLSCLFGLRHTVIWYALNTFQYNLTCWMVQSTDNPLWPMALVHGVSKVVNEKILCAGVKMPGLLDTVCAAFSLDYDWNLFLMLFILSKVFKKKNMVPQLTLLIIVWKWDDPNSFTAWKTLFGDYVCCMFLCPGFLRSFEDAPRFANLIIKSMLYFCQRHHIFCQASSLHTAVLYILKLW